METPSYLSISLLFLLASYLFTSLFRRRFSNLPPTVFPALPVIGHLHLLKPPLHKTLAKISAKHGPILFLRFGSRRVLLVSSPSIAEECLAKNDIIFANRPKMLFGKIIGANYTSIVWASYSDNWRNLRRIAATQILSVHRLNGFHDIFAEERSNLISKFGSTSAPVTVRSVLYELTLNVMMRMICGKRYFGCESRDLEEEGKRFAGILNETSRLAAASNVVDFLPVVRWFRGKRLEKELIAVREKRDVFFQRLIEELRKSEVGNKRKTMIEVLVSLQESDPEYYTDLMIRSFVLALLSGGSDTSLGTMEWAMATLVNHPEVLQKAQKEIDQVIGHNRLVDELDIANLPYLRCIINETQRLYPAGPLLVPHEASEDCVIAGYNIPRGTMLIVNQWAIQHDPKVWDEPERFIPERFEGLKGTRDGFKLMPFGSGRRSCPGEGMAIRLMGMTLGSIIQCFDWERTSEEKVDMTEAPGLTMNMAVPLVAKCKPRLEMKNLLSQV